VSSFFVPSRPIFPDAGTLSLWEVRLSKQGVLLNADTGRKWLLLGAGRMCSREVTVLCKRLAPDNTGTTGYRFQRTTEVKQRRAPKFGVRRTMAKFIRSRARSEPRTEADVLDHYCSKEKKPTSAILHGWSTSRAKGSHG